MYNICMNADFDAGNGPMLPLKVYHSWKDAMAWVMSQEGIQGTEQAPYNRVAVSFHGKIYAISHCNGYTIKPIAVK